MEDWDAVAHALRVGLRVGLLLLQWEGELEVVGVVDWLTVWLKEVVPQVLWDTEKEEVTVVDWEGVTQGVADTVVVVEGVRDREEVGESVGVWLALPQ